MNFKKFEVFSLEQNSIRSLMGGKDDTTWTSSSGGAGTDTCLGQGRTAFSDNTTSDKDTNTCP